METLGAWTLEQFHELVNLVVLPLKLRTGQIVQNHPTQECSAEQAEYLRNMKIQVNMSISFSSTIHCPPACIPSSAGEAPARGQ